MTGAEERGASSWKNIIRAILELSQNGQLTCCYPIVKLRFSRVKETTLKLVSEASPDCNISRPSRRRLLIKTI